MSLDFTEEIAPVSSRFLAVPYPTTTISSKPVRFSFIKILCIGLVTVSSTSSKPT